MNLPRVHRALHRVRARWLAGLLPLAAVAAAPDSSFTAPLPAGVAAIWDPAAAHREATPTRERVCLNGLWRWQPAEPGERPPPTGQWGFFKVPGSWPGIGSYIQKDSQVVFSHAAWRSRPLPELEVAWYEREIAVPATWAGRGLRLSADYVNSLAVVWIDGRRVGELRYPGGELDVGAHCRPGNTHRLSLQVSAMPLRAVLVSYSDSNQARAIKGRVERRGLCGDLFLVGQPAGARLADVKVDPSWRRGETRVEVGLEGLEPARRYRVEVRVARAGAELHRWRSPVFVGREVLRGRLAFVERWRPELAWDLHTPNHLHDLVCTLVAEDGAALDEALPVRFGFREFWTEGRDFVLNGTRLQLFATTLDNAQVSTVWASYEGARETFRRLRRIGFNFVYTHNYGCEPGAHLSFAEVLRAADDVGILVAFSQPHFSHYEWGGSGVPAGYAEHAERYVRRAQNHPSVVAYALSHNAAGYIGDMDPDRVLGQGDLREPWSRHNASLALRAEAVVRQLDESRVLYHHAAGNLGALHTVNFYANFAPPQELSDWFAGWAARGVKPLFLCEYAAPFSWDWTLYRGFYQGRRDFGSARVPWHFALAEWNAQFLGDAAFPISGRERDNLRWEAARLKAGQVWHRWDYPTPVNARELRERDPILAQYHRENWPAFRLHGVSAVTPWEWGLYWRIRPQAERQHRPLPVAWDRLQRPGYSPDYAGDRFERPDLAYTWEDWEPTEAGQAFLRGLRPVLACLAGKLGAPTSRDQVFTAGEAVEKQAVVFNNGRTPVRAELAWSAELPGSVAGASTVEVPPGGQVRVPVRLALPADLPLGRRTLTLRARLPGGETQEDALSFEVLAAAPAPPTTTPAARIGLLDPKGHTAALLRRIGVPFRTLTPRASLEEIDVLVIGREAIGLVGETPDFTRVRRGLKVLCFEQSAEVLEGRFGFRVATPGLRQVFPRVAGHAALAGLAAEHLVSWRGEATLLPPRLDPVLKAGVGPTVTWAGLTTTRGWRAGNRGNVASVVIEKPARGDFLPVVDGGFGLQYAALLEYREGNGLVVFCQLDVSGRTEAEPAAERFAAQLVAHVTAWRPAPRRAVAYAGSDEGRRHLEAAGFNVSSYRGGSLPGDRLLVLGPGAGSALRGGAADLGRFLQAGGRIAGLGLGPADALVLPVPGLKLENGELLAPALAPFPAGSPFAGIGPADLHDRDPRLAPLVVSGAGFARGVIASAASERVALLQLVPWGDARRLQQFRANFRRHAYATSRLLANLGAEARTPLLEHLARPVASPAVDKRWLRGLYLDVPEEWDDPYRFFRW